MPNFSDYAESGILNLLFRSNTNSFAAPANISIALCRDVPSESNTGSTMNELPFSNGYGRVNLGAPANSKWTEVSQTTGTSSGTIENVSAVTFPTATADWGYVSGVAICDSYGVGSGNIIVFGRLGTPRDVKNGDTFQFNAGDIDLLLS